MAANKEKLERLQKVLAAAGLGSRRKCEELILQGRVTVDGKVIKKLGTKVNPSKSIIKCDGEPIKIEKKKYFVFFKPKGCICTNKESSKYIRVIDFFNNIPLRLYTVGRLDKDSEGIILVTNDGELAQKLTHPKYQIEKVYRVIVRGNLNNKKLKKIEKGVWISEGKVIPKKVKLIKSSEKSSIVEVTLTEGKRRAVRRVFAKIGHPVSRLLRIRFGIFEIGTLKPGKYRLVTSQELKWIEKIKNK